MDNDFLKYHLTKKIGEGYFSETFRSFDRIIEREVLLKIIKGLDQISRKNIQLDYDMLTELFLNESRTLQLASIVPFNKHVPMIFDADFSRERQRFYLVQEFVNGIILWDMIRDRKYGLDAKKVANYALQMFEGLKDIHSIGIIHKDLKHDSLILGNDGLLKIVDFGLAEKIDYSKSQQARSSLFFMPPERIEGNMITKLSDVWSAGVVLYRLLSGILPFNSMDEILKKDPKQITSIVPGIPDYLEFVIESALQKDVAKRGSSKMLHDILRNENNSASSFGAFDVYAENLRESLLQRLVENSMIIPDFEKQDLNVKEYYKNSRWWDKRSFDGALSTHNLVSADNRGELAAMYLKFIHDFCEKKGKIPLYINLSKAYHRDLEAEIISSVNDLAKVEIEPTVIRDKIGKGECVLMIDGTSENSNRDMVADDVSRFLHSFKNLEVIVGCAEASFDKDDFGNVSDIRLAPFDELPSILIDKMLNPALHDRFYMLKGKDKNIGAMANDFDMLRYTLDYVNESGCRIELSQLYSKVVSRMLDDASRKTKLPASLIRKVLQNVSFELYKSNLSENIKRDYFEDTLIGAISAVTGNKEYEADVLRIKDLMISTRFMRSDRRAGYTIRNNLVSYFAALEISDRQADGSLSSEDMDNFVSVDLEEEQRQLIISSQNEERSSGDFHELPGLIEKIPPPRFDECIHPFNFLASMRDYSSCFIARVAKKNIPFSERLVSYGKNIPVDVADKIISDHYADLSSTISDMQEFFEIRDLRDLHRSILHSDGFDFQLNKSLENALMRSLRDKRLLSNIPLMGYDNPEFQTFLLSRYDSMTDAEKAWAMINANCAFTEVADRFIQYYEDVRQDRGAEKDESIEQLIASKSVLFGKLAEGLSDLRNIGYVDTERTRSVLGLIEGDEHKNQILEFVSGWVRDIPELNAMYNHVS